MITNDHRFHGDAAPNIPLVDVEENSSSIIEDTKLRVAEYVKSFRLDMWLARHTRESVLPVIASVLKALKTDFADNLVENGGIYVVGYCFGGKYALLLGSEEVATSIECPKVKAVAIAHGTYYSIPES